MTNHRFTLVLTGVAKLTSDLADALYEATNGDIEFNMRNGVAFLEFDRAAPTLREAITSGIAEVESADLGLRVVRVESESANIIAKINATKIIRVYAIAEYGTVRAASYVYTMTLVKCDQVARAGDRTADCVARHCRIYLDTIVTSVSAIQSAA